MSRVGKKIIEIPAGTDVQVSSGIVNVKGKLGSISVPILSFVKVSIEDGKVSIDIQDKGDKKQFAMWGTTRALIQNAINGVNQEFSQELFLTGVGYKFEQQGNKLKFALGFSHPVEMMIPDNVKVEADSKTLKILVKGIDKQAVGQFAAKVYSLKPCEPYKLKGFRYTGRFYKKKEVSKKK